MIIINAPIIDMKKHIIIFRENVSLSISHPKNAINIVEV